MILLLHFKSKPMSNRYSTLCRVLLLNYNRWASNAHRKPIVVMSKASTEHAGQTDREGRKKIVSKVEVLGPGQICTETYLLLSTFDTESEANNLKGYVKTRFFRFLTSTILLTQNIAKYKFQFIPNQDFSKSWNDEELYAKYGLTDDEIAFIESMIRPME